MKRCISIAALALMAMTALAQDNQLDTRFSGNFASKYMWRGINRTNGMVFQPALRIDHNSGLGFVVWGNLDISDINGTQGEFTELRYMARYKFSYEAFDAAIGFIAYDFQQAGAVDTAEAFGVISFNTPGNLTFRAYRDVDEAEGLYVEASAHTDFANAFRLPGGDFVPVTLTGWVGYSEKNHSEFWYGSSSSTIANIGLELSTKLKVGSYSVVPWIAYDQIIDNDLLPGTDRKNISAGVWFGFQF